MTKIINMVMMQLTPEQLELLEPLRQAIDEAYKKGKPVIGIGQLGYESKEHRDIVYFGILPYKESIKVANIINPEDFNVWVWTNGVE